MDTNKILSKDEERTKDRYYDYLSMLTDHFDSQVKNNPYLFTINTGNLFDTWLNNIPAEARQHYNCNACKHFVNRFGGLVIIKEDGSIEPAMWPENVPPFFMASVTAVRKQILRSKVDGFFISNEFSLGYPVTGTWHHMAVILPSNMVTILRDKTAHQLMAEKLEEHKMLISALRNYPERVVDQAIALLQTEALYRSDKCLGVAEWFKKVHTTRSRANDSREMSNLTWLAVATAPVGFCHVNSTMIGTLLDDIVSGLSFDAISRRFAEKMDPSKYMRSQVAPTQGNIDEAEKVVASMGIASSLRRRYATLEEIPQFLWRGNIKEVAVAPSGSVFGNIIAKGRSESSSTIDLPTTTMTWDKFQKTVLPSVDSIEAQVSDMTRFMALVTAADETAPNIMQWGNPFSWYYHGGIDGEIKRRVENAGGRYENNEIRCSLIWEGYTDLDLHCITPSSRHIYYSSKQDGTGGWLDVDANGGSPTTNKPVENIRWANDARPGRYKFYIHNYHERGKGTTPFKVELEVNGRIYSYEGVAGSTGFEKNIFIFDYAKGLDPQFINTIDFSTTAAFNATWNAQMHDFVKVNGITTSPNLWGENPVSNSGTHIFFLLDGCKDKSEGKGRGFFNEMLVSGLHSVRKTLEAYCANTPVEGADRASACGIGYTKDNAWNLTLRVTSNNSTRLIKIDRFD